MVGLEETSLQGLILARGRQIDLVDFLHVVLLLALHLPNCTYNNPLTTTQHITPSCLPTATNSSAWRTLSWTSSVRLARPTRTRKELSLTYHDEQPTGIPYQIQLDTKETPTDRQ